MEKEGPVMWINRFYEINSSPTVTPPKTLPWPSINFVAECTTKCAPIYKGCKYAKQLSITKICAFGNIPYNSKSIISTAGFVGIQQKNLCVKVMKLSIVSGSFISKYDVWIFHFGK
jgi:hypothetical protein